MITQKFFITDKTFKVVITDYYEKYNGEWIPSLYDINCPRVDGKYLLVMFSYVGPNRKPKDTEDQLVFVNDVQCLEEGWPGNSDHNIRKFYGWRGTTDDTSVHAYGLAICKSVTVKSFQSSGRYTFEFSRII